MMNRRGVFIAILLAYLVSSGAVEVSSLEVGHAPWWVKSYGGQYIDRGKDVGITEDGDIIVVGWTNSFGVVAADLWVLRLDRAGNVEWQRTYGSLGRDEATAVAIAPNGDIVVVGMTYGFGAGESDLWVLRLDKNGNILWEKSYGGKNNDKATDVAIALNGEIIVIGTTESFGNGGMDAWVLCLDAYGRIKWQKTYGGKYTDEAESVTLTKDGEIVVAGSSSSFTSYGTDGWIFKLDGEGNILWQKLYGLEKIDGFNSVVIAENGDIIAAGWTSSKGAGLDDIWVVRMDGNGNVKWSKTYGTSGNENAYALHMASDGTIVVVGVSEGVGFGEKDILLAGIGGDGNILWSRVYGWIDNDEARSVTVTDDDSLIIVGRTANFGAGNDDLWLLHLPRTGELSVWNYVKTVPLQSHNIDVRVLDSQALSNSDCGCVFVPLQVAETEAGIVDSNAHVATQYLGVGKLRIISEPLEAKVYVNYKYIGDTPVELELAEGTYKVTVSREGYRDWNGTVKVTAQQTVNLTVTLSKESTETTSTIQTASSTETQKQQMTTTSQTSSTSTTTTTWEASQESYSTTTSATTPVSEKSICGPALFILAALVPVFIKRGA